MIRKTKYSILAAVAGLALGTGVLTASAANPNLLQNGDFSSGIDHWQIGPSTPWAGVDWWDGYAKVHNTAPWDLKTFAFAGQCVPVEAGKEYDVAAESFLPGGQEREGGGQLVLIFKDAPNCAGSQLTGWETGTVAVEDTWGGMSMTRMAPDGAKSAWVYLSATKNKPYVGQDWEAPLTVYFDNVYFGLATSEEPVREDEDEPGDGPMVLEEPENPESPDEPHVEGEDPQDEPQREPGDEPQREPGDEPQDKPGDEPQGDQPQTLDEPKGENEPLPPSTGTGIGSDSPELMLAAGLIGAAMAAGLGGAALMPARRKR